MTSKPAVALACLAIWTLGVSACSHDVEREKREYIERGDRYVKDRNVDAAIIEYRNAIQQDPKFADAYRKLSAAYLSRGDGDDALRAAVTAADLLPDVADAQLEAGGVLLLAGKFAEAKTYAEKVLAKNAGNVRARVLLGDATAGLKDIDTAIKEFEEAIRLDPQQSGSYTGLAALKATAGDREAAERIFKQAITTDPKSVGARLGLAQFYWAGERLADAERLMQEAHEILPRDPRVNVTIAVFYQATRRGAEAEPYLRAAVDANKDPRLTMMLADYYIARNRGPEAAILLAPLATDGRVGAQASMRLAGIAQAQGHPAEAIAVIDRALTLEPKNSGTLIAKSDLLRQQNKLDEALTVADSVVTANPSSAEAQFVRGRILRAKGSFEKAEEAFNEVLRLNPRVAVARVELARLRIRSGADDAVRVATEAAQADPRSIDARLTLARALMQQHEYAKGQAVLEEVLRAAPDVALVHAQMGSLLAMKRDLAGARAAYARALELDPLQLEAVRGLTALDFAAGQRKEAIARLDALLARAPSNPGILLVAAGAQASDNNFARAEALLLAAIDADPAALNAYSMLGRLYMAQKRLDAARSQFEKIAARQERPVGAFTMIGTIDLLQNRTADAQQAFERALKFDPKAGVAANNLAWIYLENGGSLDLALHFAEIAVAVLPDAPEVNDTLGWAHYKKGSMPAAITALRRSSELDPKNATIAYHLALAYEKSGNRDDARTSMTLYLQLDPSSDRSVEIRRRLLALGT